MNNYQILCTILTLVSFNLVPAKGQKKAEKGILNNFAAQEECWNRQDMACYCRAYAELDSIRTISSSGVTYGKDNILSDYLKWPKDKMGKLHFDELQIEKLSKRYYFVTGRFNLTYPDAKVRSGYFSAIMIRTSGQWKIYTDHSG